MSIAIYPGSFDPVTLGHLSLVTRAKTIFDEVVVVVMTNASKTPLFSGAERAQLFEGALKELGVETRVHFVEHGLVADVSLQLGASSVVKGLRGIEDFAKEAAMATVNRDLSGVETVFLASETGLSHVSSTLVKEVFFLGGDVSKYVTSNVLDALRSKARD